MIRLGFQFHSGKRADGRHFIQAPDLKFAYVNWEGHRHEYVVTPESVEYGHYHGNVDGSDEGPAWLLHAQLVTRDGDTRSDLMTEGLRRRTFLLDKIEHLEIVS